MNGAQAGMIEKLIEKKFELEEVIYSVDVMSHLPTIAPLLKDLQQAEV